MNERLVINLTAVGIALVFTGVWSHRGLIWAQDTIVSRAVEDETLITRRGTILEWRGGEVVIDSVGGPKRIPTSRVVEFQTTWQPSYMQARQLMDQRQLLEAAPHLVRAIEDEPRAWARHVIRADVVRCLHLSGQDLAAAQHFIELIGEDPQTRFLWTIPLAWGMTSQDPHLLNAARSWLGASHPAISLLGASWLLSSPERPAALKVLEELSRDIDPQIAHLASAQLWQTQWMSADARQLERWLTQIERMPWEIRPGPRHIAAETLARQGRPADAILEWMKTVILSGDQYRLGLTALERSATILAEQGDSRAALHLHEEIVRDFPGTAAANQSLMWLNRSLHKEN